MGVLVARGRPQDRHNREQLCLDLSEFNCLEVMQNSAYIKPQPENPTSTDSRGCRGGTVCWGSDVLVECDCPVVIFGIRV